jgi:hypothetical protein
VVRVEVVSVDAFAAVSADLAGSPKLLAQAVLGGMPSPLAMKALPEILLFPLVLLWTSAAFTGFTAITTTFLCKEQSFWSEPYPSHDCSLVLDELGDDLIGGGCHRGVIVHHEHQEDFPLVVRWDSAKEVEAVLLLTDLGEYLCSDCISVNGLWPSAEIVICDFLNDSQCVVVDISAVL